MDICIFGAGSLGSLVGGLLTAEHDVTLVGRNPHIASIQENGLEIRGEFERTVTPTARTEPPAETELVLVTVKSFDTETAARELTGISLEGILSLQNGMGNESTLAKRLEAKVLAGTCTYGARLGEPGVVECTGLGELTLGAYRGGSSAFADEVWAGLTACGIDGTVATDMPRRLWLKLAVNAGINATTSLARVPNGAIVDGPAKGVARAAARETAAVARRNGVELTVRTAIDWTLEVAERTAANTSSMQQDIRNEKRTEIDAINGYVVDEATEPVPVNETLTHLIRAWETDRGLR